jgi:hypothetical protein
LKVNSSASLGTGSVRCPEGGHVNLTPPSTNAFSASPAFIDILFIKYSPRTSPSSLINALSGISGVWDVAMAPNFVPFADNSIRSSVIVKVVGTGWAPFEGIISIFWIVSDC